MSLIKKILALSALTCLGWAVALAGAQAAEPVTITVFAAGTLAQPFSTMAREFERTHPGIVVQPQFGGSVKMVKRVTVLGQVADVVAVADYTVIPKYMFGEGGQARYADWYVGFVGNAVTFIYTRKSKFASEINANNWFDVLARPGVEIGRSNPDTDPSGYQTLQMLSFAAPYYHRPLFAQSILPHAPECKIRDTEKHMILALQLGQIDYLAIYRSDALQHHFSYLSLPASIDLSDPKFGSDYARISVHTKNGDLTAKPIVYGLTIPRNAPHPQAALAFVQFVLSPAGRAIAQDDGFKTLVPAYAVHPEQMPAALHPLTQAWPGH